MKTLYGFEPYRFPPETGAFRRRHQKEEHIDGGKLAVQYEGKAVEPWNPETGKAYYGKGEPRHNLKNVGSKPVHLLLLEMKDRPAVHSSR